MAGAASPSRSARIDEYIAREAEHAERLKGTLAPGMLADLAVLSQDIFRVSAEALPATESVLTLVGGQVAYDAGVLAERRRARAIGPGGQARRR
jgi:hypothetical protein